jgi:hypothetical protein
MSSSHKALPFLDSGPAAGMTKSKGQVAELIGKALADALVRVRPATTGYRIKSGMTLMNRP